MIGLTVALALWGACPGGIVAVPASPEAMERSGEVLATGLGVVAVTGGRCVWCLSGGPALSE